MSVKRKLGFALGLLTLLISAFVSTSAFAQTTTKLCLSYMSSGQQNCYDVNGVNPLPVVSGTATGFPTANVSFARPANTNTYGANSAVCTVDTPCTPLAFVVAGSPGSAGFLTTARLVKSTSTTTNASFRLWLWSAAPTLTGVNDDSTFQGPVAADSALVLGYFDFLAPIAVTTNGTTSVMYEGSPSQGLMAFALPSTSTTVYGLLEVTAAYVPGSAEQFKLQLSAKP